mmetsp:Transcript_49157/g.117100  ORF Transcript_49157/g.117100 Transcript_49157/m.117100 type:complete len:115 (-) Transcript_49157:120-464(-)
MSQEVEQKRHTILLMQFNQDKESRSYIDFESVPLALDGVCQLYEQEMKEANPSLRSVTYEIADLFRYIDSLGDLCCLVFNPTSTSNSYVPHNKEWIKAKVFEHIKNQVSRSSWA